MSYKFSQLETCLYPHPLEQFLNERGLAEIRGQEYNVKSMSMSEETKMYTISLQGNDGIRTFDTPQQGIALFTSRVPDIGSLTLHPISEGYSEILAKIEGTIQSLRNQNHANMIRLNAFSWWSGFIEQEKLIVSMPYSEYSSRVDAVRWCARSLERDPERTLTTSTSSVHGRSKAVELFGAVTHARWTKNTQRKCVRALSVNARTGNPTIDPTAVRYEKGTFAIARFKWPSSVLKSERSGFHLPLCLMQFTENVTVGDIEDQRETEVLWYRSTAKTYNGQWRKWLVGRRRSRPKKRCRIDEEWVSKIHVSDIVVPAHVKIKDDESVRIEPRSVRAVEEFMSNQQLVDCDSDSDSEEDELH